MMMLFDAIIGGIMLYGAEVWSYEMYAGVKQKQMKHIYLVGAGLKSTTQNYEVLEKTLRDELSVEASRRGMMFEERNGRKEDKGMLYA